MVRAMHLNCCSTKHDFVSPELSQPDSSGLLEAIAVDCKIYKVIQKRKYGLQVNKIDEIEQRLVEHWQLSVIQHLSENIVFIFSCFAR